jgi:hypothetical protein
VYHGEKLGSNGSLVQKLFRQSGCNFGGIHIGGLSKRRLSLHIRINWTRHIQTGCCTLPADLNGTAEGFLSIVENELENSWRVHLLLLVARLIERDDDITGVLLRL